MLSQFATKRRLAQPKWPPKCQLAAIAGRQLVIADASHAGELAVNPAWPLVSREQGPIIMAGCDRNQQCHDGANKKHGVFTEALLEALG